MGSDFSPSTLARGATTSNTEQMRRRRGSLQAVTCVTDLWSREYVVVSKAVLPQYPGPVVLPSGSITWHMTIAITLATRRQQAFKPLGQEILGL